MARAGIPERSATIQRATMICFNICRRWHELRRPWQEAVTFSRRFTKHSKCGRHDIGEPVRGVQFIKLVRMAPADFLNLVVRNGLARDQSCGKAKNDEVAFGAPAGLTRDHLSIAGKRRRL